MKGPFWGGGSGGKKEEKKKGIRQRKRASGVSSILTQPNYSGCNTGGRLCVLWTWKLNGGDFGRPKPN